MNYQYFSSSNYEDFASGRVIIHRAGRPGYPVRIAGEIFSRCLSYLDKQENIRVYDPCCGSGYLLTVLGLLFPCVGRIYGSDIDEEALALAQSNLALLSVEGLEKRKAQLEQLADTYGKPSHRDALASVEKWIDMVSARRITTDWQVFQADMLDADALAKKDFQADIVITDLPYGKMAAWSESSEDAADRLLNAIAPVLHASSVIAVSFDKKQKIRSEKLSRLEKHQIGKRRIELLSYSHRSRI